MMWETPWLPGAAHLRLDNPRNSRRKADAPSCVRWALLPESVVSYAVAGTGSAVTDLIFSIAKREVTFFSGTAPISFL